MTGKIERARGCLLGQLAGDSLGGLVEFMRAAEIRQKYPDGVRDMADGGTWGSIAGQVTDDSEMALALARTLVEWGSYDAVHVRHAYVDWMKSGPFDIGTTTSAGLLGHPNHGSQANGALMRVSPLGIFCAGRDLQVASDLAAIDAAITHPNPVCVAANRLYVMAIAYAVEHGPSAQDLYGKILEWAGDCDVDSVVGVVKAASSRRPQDYQSQQGWVLIAFQNALWQLLHATSLEDGIVDTIMQGGDTDTNACICGALLGAVHGESAVPGGWVESLQSCRPEAGRPGVRRPRPRTFWPCDALDLADALIGAG